MALVLYYHPLSSFCQKVLIALYENAVPFEARIVDLGDEDSSAELKAFWPLAKIPLLRDEALDRTYPETSIIIEHLTQAYPGPVALIPAEPDRALQARLWDRVFDLYVNVPIGKIVADRLRPVGQGDPLGVEAAKGMLATAYDIIERQVAGKAWAVGDEISIADCAAAPALFYAETAVPFSRTHPETAAYRERLMCRPAVARTLEEARPYFQYYPLRESLPERYRVA